MEFAKIHYCERHITTAHSEFGYRCSICKAVSSRYDSKHLLCPGATMNLVKRANMKYGKEEERESKFIKKRRQYVQFIKREPATPAEKLEAIRGWPRVKRKTIEGKLPAKQKPPKEKAGRSYNITQSDKSKQAI
ncbi:hypothetical protein CHS0354_025824 [Potamilus streckersoni]|uniref:Uncharacterized protein n=1 Tax=Potamilus streckersoni TaxID=2493646 RepID=A0AAE0SM11_9BIVA|nr:hypothetical protein CHS0354_025824 [Potamilus streckersoni]